MPDPLIMGTPATLSIEQRILLAQRCRDCDGIAKVADAGLVRVEPDGTRVQVMHNGLRVLADGYCGEWMTRLIAQCHGHHEPQEERLFDAAVCAMPPDAAMVEIGGNWSYYTAWFLQGQPGRRAVVLEPDPANRAVGERTMALNGLRASFVAASAGAETTPPTAFATERSGTIDLPCRSVPDLLADHGVGHLHLLHCDAQGAELAVLSGCRALFAAGRIGTVFISTHVHQISGDPLTHRRCLDLLRQCGAVIEAEHDPYESFSGDGLIVARFGPAPEGWQAVPISRARAGEALFRHPCFDLADAQAKVRSLAEEVAAGLFDALLFRKAEPAALDHFAGALVRGDGFAAILRHVLQSPEFAAKRAQFDAALPREQSGPFACTAVELTLQRNGPLGTAGETLVLPNDRMILPAVLASGGWNMEQVAFAASRLDPARPAVVLDIGANVGLFSRQLLAAGSPIQSCHCIEPDPANVRALRRNLDGFRDAGIHIHPIALGAADGTMRFFRDTENCGNYSLHEDAMRGRPFTERSVTVAAASDWLERHFTGDAPILWKSDTQGSDELIVAQAPWPVWRRVTAAVIELWRIRKGGVPAGFIEKVVDFPNRRLGGVEVSPEAVVAYLASDDWAHDDLYLWR